MSSASDELNAILLKYYIEGSQGIEDIAPSRLTRGQGTTKNFFIFKIDLANSTEILRFRQQATYLKLAHIFLSSIDEITHSLGADSNQTEYLGDGLIVYFPEDTPIDDILVAAIKCKTAVLRLGKLDATLAKLNLEIRLVIHYAPLVVSKIGRRGDSILSAIGFPIHQVSKIEKTIDAGVGRVTKEFYNRVPKNRRQYLLEVRSEVQPPTGLLGSLRTLEETTVTGGLLGRGLFGISKVDEQPTSLSSAQSIAKALYSNNSYLPIPPITPPTTIGYNLNWFKLKHDLGL